MTNSIIENIRQSLGRTALSPIDPRPAIYASRQPEELQIEAEHFLDEVRKLSGVGQTLSSTDLDAALKNLVREQNVRKATVWETLTLRQLGVAEILDALGVELVSPNADKLVMAECDLGITEADASYDIDGWDSAVKVCVLAVSPANRM